MLRIETVNKRHHYFLVTKRRRNSEKHSATTGVFFKKHRAVTKSSSLLLQWKQGLTLSKTLNPVTTTEPTPNIVQIFIPRKETNEFIERVHQLIERLVVWLPPCPVPARLSVSSSFPLRPFLPPFLRHRIPASVMVTTEKDPRAYVQAHVTEDSNIGGGIYGAWRRFTTLLASMGFMDRWIVGGPCSARFRSFSIFFSVVVGTLSVRSVARSLHLHPRSRNRETSDAPAAECESDSGSTKRVGGPRMAERAAES